MPHRPPQPTARPSLRCQARLGGILAWAALTATACASEAGSAAPTGPREVMLSLNQGVALTSGEVTGNASYLKVDLVLYKNKSGFDLKPGSETPGQQLAMGVFAEGGIETVFASLDEVPETKAQATSTTYMSGVGTGFGAVVQHNLDDGWSKIWVKQAVASAGTIVLQWQAID